MIATEILKAHIPSLTEAAEDEMDGIVSEDMDYADFAVRYCHCGLRIDGFYEYVDHLKELFRKEGI